MPCCLDLLLARLSGGRNFVFDAGEEVGTALLRSPADRSRVVRTTTAVSARVVALKTTM